MSPAEFKRKMRRLERDLLSHDIMEELAREAVDNLKKMLKLGKSGDGRRFQRLSNDTIRQRQAQGIASSTPMNATGKLIQSITFQKVERGGGRGKITTYKIGPGNPRGNELAIIHHAGNEKLPSRSILGLPSGVENKIDRKVTDDLQRRCNKILG